ncbi:hypothetical protein PIB30_094008 [Stylosanthes scabra]|uniref:Uncharacterized protein n=1 Tax=Stylosanthes scabra TaxID=79078 RepID=A0ABU6RW79_9FABA|nr:hypothetical protein [Stylosanthes scabra]
MASPLKAKSVDEVVNPKNIKNLIEQSNYTSRFLQCLGDKLSSSSKPFSLQNIFEPSTSKTTEKPLFKPFKISNKAKQSLKTSILKQDSGDSEILQKVEHLLSCLNTVPETPTNSRESFSCIQTRSSKAINAIDHKSNESQDSDQSLDSDSPRISPIMTNSMTK